MPCPLHALLTPRGSLTFRTTIRPRNLHPLKATQSPICTTQSRPMAGHKSQRRNPTSHLADARGKNVWVSRGRGKPVAKREMQQFQGILSSRVPRPPPLARPPKVTFYVCRAFKRLAQGSSFQAAEAVASGRANERRSKPIPTCTFFVRLLEAREVMCPCPPGLTGSGAARGP